MKRIIFILITVSLLFSITGYAQDTYQFVLKWGSWGSGDGQFIYPGYVAVDSDGYVYVADSDNKRLQKFDSNGNFITKWGSFGSGDGQFSVTCGVAVDSDGYVYVADVYNHRIQKFDSNGNFITKWGSGGGGDGQFSVPYGVAVGSDGYVYVADTNNHRIQKFDSNGNFITKWGSFGSADGQFNVPYGVAIDSDGYVYVSDTYNFRIEKFDSNGNFITKWGSCGGENGQFNYQIGVAVDSEGYVYVADQSNLRIQKFAPPYINVSIDIKPGSFPNSINPRSNGNIPVAILTTDTFNATKVNTATVRFGKSGTEAKVSQSSFEDVNGDGRLDLMLHFKTQETGIACGDTAAILKGSTIDGKAIKGSDSIQTVGCK